VRLLEIKLDKMSAEVVADELLLLMTEDGS
jgi:hypothetical protein